MCAGRRAGMSAIRDALTPDRLTWLHGMRVVLTSSCPTWFIWLNYISLSDIHCTVASGTLVSGLFHTLPQWQTSPAAAGSGTAGELEHLHHVDAIGQERPQSGPLHRPSRSTKLRSNRVTQISGTPRQDARKSKGT